MRWLERGQLWVCLEFQEEKPTGIIVLQYEGYNRDRRQLTTPELCQWQKWTYKAILDRGLEWQAIG